MHLKFLGVDFSRSFRTFREREVAQTFLSVRGECTDRMSVPPRTGRKTLGENAAAVRPQRTWEREKEMSHTRPHAE